jgi:Protein of unknown function (DUF2975)
VKKDLSIFLQAVTLLIGVGVLAFMLWEPQVEGVNAHATLFEIYFKDPFLAYVYTASIFFFVAVYQAVKLFGLLGRKEGFSERSVKALRTIKYCAMALAASIVAAQCYLFIVVRDRSDDIAGGAVMSLFLLFVSVAMATVAAVFQRRVQNALNMKSA